MTSRFEWKICALSIFVVAMVTMEIVWFPWQPWKYFDFYGESGNALISQIKKRTEMLFCEQMFLVAF